MGAFQGPPKLSFKKSSKKLFRFNVEPVLCLNDGKLHKVNDEWGSGNQN